MKIKPGFYLHSIYKQHVIMAEGEENIDFAKLVSLNESAACIWRAIEDREFTLDDMVAALRDEYEVDEETARAACQKQLDIWTEAGLVE